MGRRGREGRVQIFDSEGCLWLWPEAWMRGGLGAGKPMRRPGRSLREDKIGTMAGARMEPGNMNGEVESISLTGGLPAAWQEIYMQDLAWFPRTLLI